MYHSRSVSSHLPPHLHYHSRSNRPPPMLRGHTCSRCAQPAADLLERIEGYCNLSSLMRLRGFGQRSSADPVTKAFDSGPFCQQPAVSRSVKKRGQMTAEVFPPLFSCAPGLRSSTWEGGIVMPYLVSGPVAAEYSVDHPTGICRYPSIEIPESPWCRASPRSVAPRRRFG